MTGDRLPNAEQAIVAERKATGYLLSAAHPDGHGKALFFAAHGFSAQEWDVLAAALRVHATVNPVVGTVRTPFGVRYVVEGALQAPDGRMPRVRVVWFIREGSYIPELVTAYPMKRRSRQ